MDGMQKARLILGFFDADPAAGAPASAVLARVEALFGDGERAYVERYRNPAVRMMQTKGRTHYCRSVSMTILLTLQM